LDIEDTAYLSGAISIKYPQVINNTDTARKSAMNDLIAGIALRDLQQIENDSELTDYEVTYTVTYNSPEILSVYFNGYSNYRTAAHPNQFFYTVTIDVAKQKAVTLSELVSINPDLLEALIGGKYSAVGYDMTEEYAASIKDYLGDMKTNPDYWLEKLKNADKVGYSAASYLTPDALVVSIPVPHVMGDHIEIALNYKDLAALKTDNPLWKYLTAA
jgi:hypothetical protein